MRRCTACFRFHPGHPTFCSSCGRSFDVRICARGHRNPRLAHFCAECGSADLSTPAPPATLLHHVSGLVLYALSGLTIALLIAAVALALLSAVDWDLLMPPLLSLVLMLAFLYWTTTLLPGPVRKLGKAAGHWAIKSIGHKKEKGR